VLIIANWQPYAPTFANLLIKVLRFTRHKFGISETLFPANLLAKHWKTKSSWWWWWWRWSGGYHLFV